MMQPAAVPTIDEGNATKVYLALREAILSNRFTPGEGLVEQKLADLYEVSRTPVREALQRLHRYGLVEMVPRRGAFVARYSVEDAVEIFHMREALEGMAARLAASLIPDEQIEFLQYQLDESATTPAPERSMYEAGGPIHEAILLYCGSPRMHSAVDGLLIQITRLRALAVTAPGRTELSFNQHQSILAALRSRDPDRSEQAMREHIASTLETITRVIMGGVR